MPGYIVLHATATFWSRGDPLMAVPAVLFFPATVLVYPLCVQLKDERVRTFRGHACGLSHGHGHPRNKKPWLHFGGSPAFSSTGGRVGGGSFLGIPEPTGRLDLPTGGLRSAAQHARVSEFPRV